MKNTVFRNETSCSLVSRYERFGRNPLPSSCSLNVLCIPFQSPPAIGYDLEPVSIHLMPLKPPISLFAILVDSPSNQHVCCSQYVVLYFPTRSEICIYTSVGIATGYGLDGRGSILGRVKRLSLLHSVHTGSGAHPVCYPMDIGALSPG
jgi:hypothetical protein